MRYIRQFLAWLAYRRALAKYQSAQFYRALAAQEAEEGAALERVSTRLRMEAMS